MQVIVYAVKLRHDTGEHTVTISDSSAVSAVRRILDIEHAPRCAVVCVRQLAVVYATGLEN